MLGYSSFLLAIYALLRIHANGLFPSLIINAPIEKLDLIHRLINAPLIFWFYVKTFFYPLNLSVSWQWVYTSINITDFYIPLALDAFSLAILCFLGLYIYKKHERKHFNQYIFFAVWFLIGILFHLQIFVLDQTVAERWFYFSIAGILGIFGVLCTILQINLRNKWVILCIAIALCLLSIRTFLRSYDFRNDFILASHDITVSDTYNGEYILSHTYYEEGQFNLAKLHAERSVRLFPFITNYTNLGAIDSSMGQYKSAKESYLKALQYGGDSLPYDNLSSLALVYGNPYENIRFIKTVALKKYPMDGNIWLDLAILEYQNGQMQNAKLAILKAQMYYPSQTGSFIEYIMSTHKILKVLVRNGNLTFFTYRN